MKLIIAVMLLAAALGACAGSPEPDVGEEVGRAGERGVNATVGSIENAVRRSIRIRLPRWPIR